MPIFGNKMGHNSAKYCRNFKIYILGVAVQVTMLITKFGENRANIDRVIALKVRTDGQTDGQRHTIIRPVFDGRIKTNAVLPHLIYKFRSLLKHLNLNKRS